MNPLYVGIDVSSKNNVIYLMLPNGDKHSSFSLANSHDGSTQLVKRIFTAMTSNNIDSVLIGLEATSVYATMTQEKVFSDTFSTTALAVYEKFESAETLAKMDLQELTAFIMEKGKNRFPDPDAVAKALQKAARSSYRLPKTVNDSVNQVLAISITSIRALESQIKAFDKAITKQMELLPNVLISIPGIGPVLSAGIMAEIGDINRFQNQAALAKYAGLAWQQHQSGDFEAQTTRMIHSGNRFLKYYLCEAAFSLVRCDKEYSRFYHLKYKEVNRFQHKRALALTARKFVRLVFALLKDNRLYRPAE
ncbi:hypothetical protein B5G26_08170 [Anaerotignum lactatifermentans]|uniref:IS110 family transposase n=1 Tax=Anaerotignum lactatifermentans TaxID=160404 RepID=A0A1Y3U947_9FIRM|nr:IS110 family transposase [Anaerotignum lactatifermentans]OUN42929.1 hypothetical protein B5G26_08170 [Anaerotignum lactatifermentans]